MSKGRGTAFPTRTCVGCGSRDRQSAMLRLRRGAGERIAAEGSIGTGRSAYVHATPGCVRGLARSKGLGKSLRQTVAKEARLELIESLETKLAAGSLPAQIAQRDCRTGD